MPIYNPSSSGMGTLYQIPFIDFTTNPGTIYKYGGIPQGQGTCDFSAYSASLFNSKKPKFIVVAYNLAQNGAIAAAGTYNIGYNWGPYLQAGSLNNVMYFFSDLQQYTSDGVHGIIGGIPHIAVVPVGIGISNNSGTGASVKNMPYGASFSAAYSTFAILTQCCLVGFYA